MSYQWQKSTDNGSNWTDITGETNTTYTIRENHNGHERHSIPLCCEKQCKRSDKQHRHIDRTEINDTIEPEFVRYIVEHYKQNADGSYTLADTEQPIDEIGKTVTATPKTYEGYTYNPNAAGTVVSEH